MAKKAHELRSRSELLLRYAKAARNAATDALERSTLIRVRAQAACKMARELRDHSDAARRRQDDRQG